jgi:outer membrane protein assembly factor BamB
VADGDGTLYVGGEGYLVAIDAEGQARWILEETDEELSVQSLALGADRRLIVQTLTRLLAIGP